MEVNSLNMRLVVCANAVAHRKQSALTAAHKKLFEPHRAGHVGEQFLADVAAQACGIGRVVPAVIHGRAPQPLIRIVFQQQADKAQYRVLRQQRVDRISLVQPLQDQRRVRQPASVFQLQSRHLKHAGGLRNQAPLRLRAHRL